MDSVNRIVPINPVGSGLHLRVSESNKDGAKRQTPEEQAQVPPHDILELHDEEVALEESPAEAIAESPLSGLDLAV